MSYTKGELATTLHVLYKMKQAIKSMNDPAFRIPSFSLNDAIGGLIMHLEAEENQLCLPLSPKEAYERAMGVIK